MNLEDEYLRHRGACVTVIGTSYRPRTDVPAEGPLTEVDAAVWENLVWAYTRHADALARDPDRRELERERNRQMANQARAATVDERSKGGTACPKCGKPYGARKRCYRCPFGEAATKAARTLAARVEARTDASSDAGYGNWKTPESPPAPPASVVYPPTPATTTPLPLDREFAAMRAVADVLASCDVGQVMRILTWVADYRGVERIELPPIKDVLGYP